MLSAYVLIMNKKTTGFVAEFYNMYKTLSDRYVN